MNAAIILGGGKGVRFMAAVPKQFVHLGSKPIVQHTFEAFYFHPEIDVICITLPKEKVGSVRTKYSTEYPDKKIIVAEGGESRQESTANALQALGEILSAEDIVLIHDAVRPFISPRIISDNIKYALEFGAVDTVIPAEDTIVESEDQERIHQIPPRKRFYSGQTPQSFRYGLISRVYSETSSEDMRAVTDDASLVLKSGKPVHLVPGEKQNFKITTPWDLSLAEALLSINEKRDGE